MSRQQGTSVKCEQNVDGEESNKNGGDLNTLNTARHLLLIHQDGHAVDKILQHVTFSFFRSLYLGLFLSEV